jgi:hypothetical protein
MESLQRVKLAGFDMVISEWSVEVDLLRQATLLGTWALLAPWDLRAAIRTMRFPTSRWRGLSRANAS